MLVIGYASMLRVCVNAEGLIGEKIRPRSHGCNYVMYVLNIGCQVNNTCCFSMHGISAEKPISTSMHFSDSW
jgi:hypothetical protein